MVQFCNEACACGTSRKPLITDLCNPAYDALMGQVQIIREWWIQNTFNIQNWLNPRCSKLLNSGSITDWKRTSIVSEYKVTAKSCLVTSCPLFRWDIYCKKWRWWEPTQATEAVFKQTKLHVTVSSKHFILTVYSQKKSPKNILEMHFQRSQKIEKNTGKVG